MAKSKKPRKDKKKSPLSLLPGQSTGDPKNKPVSSITRKPGSMVSHYISFAMLLVTILVFCFFFYNVIKGFLLPLFLAILLAVIFRPFHQWVETRLNGRPHIAAALSTCGIMLIVLGPLTGIVLFSIYEANELLRSHDKYVKKAEDLRRSVGLQKPFSQYLDRIEGEMRKLDDALKNYAAEDAAFIDQAAEAIKSQTKELKEDGYEAAWELRRDLLSKSENPGTGDSLTDLDTAIAALGSEDGLLFIQADKLTTQLSKDSEVAEPNFGIEFEKNRDAEKKALKYILQRSSEDEKYGFVELVGAFVEQLEPITAAGTSQRERNQALTQLQIAYDRLRTNLLGGPIWKWGIDLVNPSKEQIQEWVIQLGGNATRWLPSITNTATSLIGGLLMGLGIMSVAMFYFFLDGAKMVNAFMHLSPLDDRHELELLQEFDKVGRAVVLATLLSAVAQGLLGGLGYWLTGLNSKFLLILLTTVLALIPFVGAAAVWVPACLYLAFIKEPVDPEGTRTWLYAKAGFLAVYGTLVISMADNIIKPLVLQGQSKLHPLLALLSVLGGVQSLGPIGIMVGPMVVSFLQVLLTILQREINSMDDQLTPAS